MSKPKIYQIDPLKTKSKRSYIDFNEYEYHNKNQEFFIQEDFVKIKQTQYQDIKNYLFDFKNDLNSLSEKYNKLEKCKIRNKIISLY